VGRRALVEVHLQRRRCGQALKQIPRHSGRSGIEEDSRPGGITEEGNLHIQVEED